MFGTFEALGSSSSNSLTKTQSRHEQKTRTHISPKTTCQREANAKLFSITVIRKAQVQTRGFQLISVKNGDRNTDLVAAPGCSNQL